MNDVRVGRIVRAVRLDRRLSQASVGRIAGVDRSVLTDLEHGRLDAVSLPTARRIAGALEIELVVEARWRGGAVDRLLDRGHAAIVEYVAATLATAGWDVVPEYTFNHFGDRGSVDLLAWQPRTRALLIVEVKTALTDLQATLLSLSRKVRVVPPLVERERGWTRTSLGHVLVVLGSTGNRSIVARHRVLFATAFPAGSRVARAWIAAPRGDIAGLWFVSPVVVAHRKANRRRPGQGR